MIATVTLDPCLDLTLGLEGLNPGVLNTARNSRLGVAGKGFDMSVALRALGIATICLGISFEQDRKMLENYLEERCIARDFAVAPGRMRQKLRLENAAKAETTVIAVPSAPVPPRVIELYLKKLAHHGHHCAAVAFCDSLGDDDVLRFSLEILKPLGLSVVTPFEGGGPLFVEKKGARVLERPGLKDILHRVGEIKS